MHQTLPYVISGFTSTLAGVLLVSRWESPNPISESATDSMPSLRRSSAAPFWEAAVGQWVERLAASWCSA